MSRSRAESFLATLAILATISVPVSPAARRSPSSAADAPAAAAPGSPVSTRPASLKHSFLRTPLRFERRGDDAAATGEFAARGIGYAVSLIDGDAVVTLGRPGEKPETIAMRLAGRRDNVRASVGRELPGRSSHVFGSEPRLWKTGIPAYAQITYEHVYRNIDLVYYGTQEQLEYDFVLHPGASPSSIVFDIAGARSVNLDRDGNLVIETEHGSLTHRAPVLYQDVHGTRQTIDGAYVIRPDGRVTFATGPYDRDLPLVIDPVLSYASYLGGSREERVHGVVIDPSGDIVVAGETYSPDFPTANAPQGQSGGFGDAFVARLTPSGNALVYATYIGGVSQDAAAAVDVDAFGAAYVTGTTFSWDFPTLNAFQAVNRGQADTFVVKLDASGALVYSTLLGGMLEDYATAIDVDASGRAHLAGSVMSADFPAVNAIQSSLGGSPLFRTTNGGDSWVGLRNGLRATGVLAVGFDPAAPDTVYAGTQMEGVFKSTDAGATWRPTGEVPGGQVYSVAVADGPAAAVYATSIAGILRSRDGGDNWSLVLPGYGASVVVSPESSSSIYAGLSTNGFPYGLFKSVDGGDSWTDTGLADGVSALAVSGSALYAATPSGVYLSVAGEGWILANDGLPSQVIALAADAGNPAVVYAASFDGLFKTRNGGVSWDLDPVFAGVPIASVAISASDSSTLLVSFQFGGAAITNDGGMTWRPTHSDTGPAWAIAIHPSVPTTAYLAGMMNRDAFVATIGAAGDTLEFSTYFGGSGHERVTDIAVDSTGARYIVGETGSTDLAVVNAMLPAFAGLQDAFAARIGPEGVTYTTYLGGSGFDSVPKLAVDASGRAHIAGLTWSSDFPVANPYQPQRHGANDAFVTVLDSAGVFVRSTYLGGAGSETDWSQSLGPDVAATDAGETCVTGTTMSVDFPVSADAAQAWHGGGQNDVFVTCFDAGGQLQYSTYLGGSGEDYGRTLSLGAPGDVVIAGYTSSTNFPTRHALQPIPAGSDEGFIARLSSGDTPSDTVPPVTTIELTGTPGSAGWYRSPVVVTLTATDGESGSGVAAIRYRLTGGALQPYTGPFTVTTEGVTEVTAQAIDEAGNTEGPGPAATISIDTTGPVVGVASPEARQYLRSRTVSVSVSISETGSGLDGSAVVTLDGAPFAGNLIDMSALSLGPHVLRASATDVAGNTSHTSVTFTVVTELDTVINVPAEAATIQAAIDLAVDGDTVLVAPGTYRELLDFRGKAIAVTSQAGPEQTVIDAGGAGSAVSFTSGETRASVLSGFTIRGGATLFLGGGLHIESSSPTVLGNVITGNSACAGGGVAVSFGSPLIQANRITRNEIAGCDGTGAGVFIGGTVAPELVNNEIAENTGPNSDGGGISLFNAGSVVIRNNVITRNSVSGSVACSAGGGIVSYGDSQATIAGNLIAGNSACGGGGIFWRSSSGNNVLVNNTIADNDAESWPGVYVADFDAGDELHNNIITAHTGPALYCATGAPTLKSNDIFSGQGAAYEGTCADQTGLTGNISADPAFIGAANRDYRVRMTSAVVDAGNGAAPALPATDLAGFDRVFDGNRDGVARVDIGAFESRNRAPVVNAGADQTVAAGVDCLGSVALAAAASDPDGDPLRLTWSGSFGTATGSTPSLVLPLGTHVITVTADDGIGGRASDTVVVTVADLTPPSISSVTATPSVIQKSNHEMVPVTLTVQAADGCGGTDCRIVSMVSNEPEDNDWELTGPLTLKVRAERLGKGNGRVYTITVACTDAAGNTATSTVTVTVPKGSDGGV